MPTYIAFKDGAFRRLYERFKEEVFKPAAFTLPTRKELQRAEAEGHPYTEEELASRIRDGLAYAENQREELKKN